MGSCMSVEPPPVKSYTPPVAQPVSQVVYTPPSADYVKPSAPVYTNYTYAYPPQQQAQWVNPTYQYQYQQQQQQQQQQQYQQYQMYQYQYPQQYGVAPPSQQNQGHGLAIAGGLVAGMLAANIIDDITDPY